MSEYAIGSNVWPGMSKLIEEMGELQQVLGKLIAIGGASTHWDGSNLVDRVEEEVGDVMAALTFFIEQNHLSSSAINERVMLKLDLFRTWHSEQGDLHWENQNG